MQPQQPDHNLDKPINPQNPQIQTPANPPSPVAPVQAYQAPTPNQQPVANNAPVAAYSEPQIQPAQQPTTTSSGSKGDPWYKNTVFSYALVVVSAVVLALIINTFILQSYVVVGTSMTPTLQDGNRLIVDKVPVSWHKIFGGDFIPSRGNIIIFDAPIKITENGMPAEQLIKRVIGLPGDHVVVKNGKITIYNAENPNGFNPDDKPYGKNLAPTAGDVDLTIPDGYIFVCGDNRVPGGSFDSRSELGPIPIKNIVGKLSIRYMPLSEVDKF